MKKLARPDSAKVLLARLAVAGGQVLLIPFAVHQLGVAGFGIYSVMLQLGLLLRLLVAEHVAQVVLRYRSEWAADGLGDVLQRLGLRYLGLSAALVAAVALASFRVASSFSLSTQQWAIAVLFGLVMGVFSYQVACLFARKAIFEGAALEGAQGLLVVGAPVAAGQLLPSPETYGLAGAAATAACSVLALCLDRRAERWLASSHGEPVERRYRVVLASYGLPLALTYLLYWVVGVADRFQIAALLGPLQTGAYVSAYQLLVAPVNLVMSAVLAGWQPSLFAMDRSQAKSELARFGRAFGAIGLAYIVASVVVGPWLVATLTGDAVRLSPLLAVILAAAGVAQGGANVATVWAKHRGLAKLVLLGVALGASVVLLGNAMLLSYFGIGAAAATTCCAYCIQGVVAMSRTRPAVDAQGATRASRL